MAANGTGMKCETCGSTTGLRLLSDLLLMWMCAAPGAAPGIIRPPSKTSPTPSKVGPLIKTPPATAGFFVDGALVVAQEFATAGRCDVPDSFHTNSSKTNRLPVTAVLIGRPSMFRPETRSATAVSAARIATTVSQ